VLVTLEAVFRFAAFEVAAERPGCDAFYFGASFWRSLGWLADAVAADGLDAVEGG
jgi:hypothetical protein